MSDHLGGNIVALEVLGPSEGNVYSDIVSELRASTRHLDEHCVHTTAALHVNVGIDGVAGCGVDTNDIADLDLLFQGDAQIVDDRGVLGYRIGALGNNQRHQRSGLGLELIAGGNEVCLALELDDGTDIALDEQGHEALGVFAIISLG
ncbi:unannotated protein [freshwater metagenome]|uniref:Unannotated protein n=1 Tax=freshwater metagenome TaxID=449393 RepID=A0A6J6YB64_9ZZZZ